VQPKVKKKIVQRHVGFAPPQKPRKVVPVESGDRNAYSLVEPERLSGEGVEAKYGRQNGNENKQAEFER
jgi:hypothetical protein